MCKAHTRNNFFCVLADRLLFRVCNSPVHALDSLQKIDRTQNIDGWNVRIYFLSRNPRVLALVALVVLLTGLGLAWLVQKPLLSVLVGEFKSAELQVELAKRKPDMAAVLEMLPKAAHLYFEDVPASEWIEESNLVDTEKLVANALWASLEEGDEFEPSADLLYYAHYIRPLRFANELVGDHYRAKGNLPKAADYYRRESTFADAGASREKLISVVLKLRDKTALQELQANPAIVAQLRPEHRVYFAAQERRWGDVVAPLRELQFQMVKPVPAALAAVAGLAWLLVALQSLQPPGLVSFRTIVPLFAVLVGAFSTFPTLISGLWMEEVFGLRHSDDMVDNFLFFMGSVGPREELMKLALALPFLPLALLRKSRLEALMLSGCVGLGFAIWENILYFAQYGSAVAFPRFLTANFFHLALTGLNGLAVYDFLRSPRTGFLPVIATFGCTVAAHGAYDFLASVGELPILVIGSMIAFMLVSLFFFRKLRELRDPATDQFCIAGTFVVGISILASTILILASREMGLIPAIAVFAITGFATVMVGYMFYWQLGEGLSPEETIARPYAL